MKKRKLTKRIGAGLLAVIFAFAGFAMLPMLDEAGSTSGADCEGQTVAVSPWEAYADEESAGFVITDYDVDVVVHEDSVYDVTETIETNFTESKHGIYRSIPTVMTIARADGSTGTAYATVRDFTANTEWSEDTDSIGESDGVDASYVVRLGDPDDTVIGEQTYEISYEYEFDGDMYSDGDEFYFNIIGTGWTTSIEHASFHIQMPKAFDTDNMGFSIGAFGTEGHQDGEMSYHVDGKEISGQTLRTLKEGEGLSIRIELPETYFTSEVKGGGLIPILLIPILLALIAAVLWFKWGRDDKIIETVEFNPPAGCNSLDVASMYKLDVQTNDVNSLLIYMADQGYLTIEPIEKSSKLKLFKSDQFLFTKIKDYTGEDACERMFMSALFNCRGSVTTEELSEDSEFHDMITAIVDLQNDMATDELVSRKGRMPVYCLAGLATIISAIPALLYGSDLFFALLSLIPGAVLIFIAMTLPKKSDGMGKKILRIILDLLMFVIIGMGAYLMGTSDVMLRLVPAIKPLFFLDLLCVLIIAVFGNLIQKRTPYGTEMAGKVLGFRTFIQTAEKDRIDKMIEADPQAFYRIIPYAYVLEVSDKWIKKFEGIELTKPDWYRGDMSMMDAYAFGNMMNLSLMNVMSSASVDTSSGGGGGGGFSGGGGGGGGGGSW